MKLAYVHGPEPGLDLKATIWNAFVELLAMSDESELNADQRPAQLVYWYESEVQNGGHLQYFLNRGPAEARKAVVALRDLGASAHAKNLAVALERWLSLGHRSPSLVDEFIEEAIEGEFTSFNNEFSVAVPLIDVLQRHLDKNQERFVVVG